jgi:hypothetical protein
VSSVNFYNGPTKDLVRVEATQAYKDLMLQLSAGPKHQPGYTSSLRRLNKRLGYPSTPDVGILSDLVARLKNATEAELGTKLDKIVLAHPRFPGLTAEDVGDAIEYAGLQSWLHLPNDDPSAPNQLSQNRAALAAHGVNLCKEYGSWSTCLDIMSLERPVTVYYVLLTTSGLYTSLDRYLQPFEMIVEHESHIFDSRLGVYRIIPLEVSSWSGHGTNTDFSSALSGLNGIVSFHSSNDYWNAVEYGLSPGNLSSGDPVTHILIGGEAAEMPEFQSALREALAKASIPTELIGARGDDFGEPVPPLFAAARGSALLARWRQEAPLNCWEDLKHCREQRKRERRSMLREENGLDWRVDDAEFVERWN